MNRESACWLIRSACRLVRVTARLPRGGVAILPCLVAALVTPACGGRPAAERAHAPSCGAACASVEAVRDTGILVLVHSFTGNTAAAGREIAAMLGGRFVRVSDPPAIPDVTPTSGARLDDTLPDVDMNGVTRLFVGFPIYDEAPSPPALEMVRRLPLEGVRVTPFFTYVHYVDPRSLAALAEQIAARGGLASAPIGLRRSVLAPREELIARVRAAVLARPELWATGDESGPRRVCRQAPPPHSARICVVPAGDVWLGSVSSTTPGLTSNPPRLYHLGAFELDEAEITVAQYRRCVDAGRCRAREARGVSAELIRAGKHLPQPDLSWSDAADYCAFAGLRLPTEAEWVRAARARGLSPYPWGDEPPGQGEPRANLGEKPGHGMAHYELAAADSEWPGDGVPGLSPACRFELGRGPFGHCDLIGNLLEWVDAPVPTAKGGSWLDVEPRFVTVGLRATIDQPDLGSYQTGARCARSLDQDDARQ